MENDLEIHQYPYEFTVYPSYEIYKDTVAILGEILFGNIIDDSFHETELELNFTTVEHGCDSTIFYHVTVLYDEDMDGFFTAEDCDDTNPDINPDQEEIVYNGIDDDCNEATLDDDLDGDGFNLAEDCDGMDLVT